MAPCTEDYLLKTNELAWHSLGHGASFRLLRYDANSGHFVIILRVEAGGQFKAHKHYGPAEFLMLKGEMAYTDKLAKVGDYGWEAMYAFHPATSVTVDTELLFIGYGPLIFLDEGEAEPLILDGGLLSDIAHGVAKPVHFTA